MCTSNELRLAQVNPSVYTVVFLSLYGCISDDLIPCLPVR